VEGEEEGQEGGEETGVAEGLDHHLSPSPPSTALHVLLHLGMRGPKILACIVLFNGVGAPQDRLEKKK
jgi:hypothetical protein